MQQYTVRSGQNIYDVSVMLYGTVEGLFDLLISNSGLSMDSTLKAGDILNYHNEFVINRGTVNWLEEHGVLVRNGEHCLDNINIFKAVNKHFQEMHPDKMLALEDCSPDERSIFWELLTIPRILVDQQGIYSQISVSLKNGTHMIIDWGDYSGIEIIEDEELIQIEHCYRSANNHRITIYGNFNCNVLDLTKLNGRYYPLDSIHVSKFLTAIEDPNLNKLITKD